MVDCMRVVHKTARWGARPAGAETLDLTGTTVVTSMGPNTDVDSRAHTDTRTVAGGRTGQADTGYLMVGVVRKLRVGTCWQRPTAHKPEVVLALALVSRR